MTTDNSATSGSDIALSTQDILRYIPHRYPLLLVDRVIKLVPHESIHAVKGVTMNEEFFQGHFPNHPVMPGVLIVEALAQAATVLASYSTGGADSAKLAYFMSIDEAKFRKPVLPGCMLDLHVEITQKRRNIYRFSGKAMVEGVVHTQGQFAATVVDPS